MYYFSNVIIEWIKFIICLDEKSLRFVNRGDFNRMSVDIPNRVKLSKFSNSLNENSILACKRK